MLTEKELELQEFENQHYIEKLKFDFITHERVEELKQEAFQAKNRYDERYELTESKHLDEELAIMEKEEAELVEAFEDIKQFFLGFIEDVLESTNNPIKIKGIHKYENHEIYSKNENSLIKEIEKEDLIYKGREIKFEIVKNSINTFFCFNYEEDGNKTELRYIQNDMYFITSPVESNKDEIIYYQEFGNMKSLYYAEKKKTQFKSIEPIGNTEFIHDVHKTIPEKVCIVESETSRDISYTRDFGEEYSGFTFFKREFPQNNMKSNFVYAFADKSSVIKKGVLASIITLDGVGDTIYKSVGTGTNGILTEFWTLIISPNGEEIFSFTKALPENYEKIETRTYSKTTVVVHYRPQLYKKIPNYREIAVNNGEFSLKYSDAYYLFINKDNQVDGIYAGFHSDGILIEGYSFSIGARAYGLWEYDFDNSEQEDLAQRIIDKYEKMNIKIDNHQYNEKVRLNKKLELGLIQGFSKKVFIGLTEYYLDGGFYFGNMKHMYAEGYGEFKDDDGNFYTGNFKKGLRDGYGKMVFSNGDIFEGEFKDDKNTGKGEYFNKESGDKYIGEFYEGFFHGKGVYHYNKGGYVSGEYLRGKLNGNAIYVDEHGSITEGFYKDDVLIRGKLKTTLKQAYILLIEECMNIGNYKGAAYWTLKSINPLLSLPYFKDKYRKYGIEYEGEFFNNLFHGYGTLNDITDTKYKGTFNNGFKSGHGEEEYLDGSFYKGNFENDIPHGMGKYYLKNGDVIIGNFSDDGAHSYCDGVMLAKNGENTRGIFRDGKLYKKIDDDDGDDDFDDDDRSRAKNDKENKRNFDGFYLEFEKLRLKKFEFQQNFLLSKFILRREFGMKMAINFRGGLMSKISFKGFRRLKLR